MAKQEVGRAVQGAGSVDVKQQDVAALLKKKIQDEAAAPAADVAAAEGTFTGDSAMVAATGDSGGLFSNTSTGTMIAVGAAIVGGAVLIAEAGDDDDDDGQTPGTPPPPPGTPPPPPASQTEELWVLTAQTDNGKSKVFEAPVVFTPDGGQRLNSLQDEDRLEGIGANAVLKVTMGDINEDQGQAVITPELVNIADIQIDWTGTVTALDLRDASGVKEISINRITANASNTATVANIQDLVAELTVQNTSSVDQDVSFEYVEDILGGTRIGGNMENGTLNLSDVRLDDLHIGNSDQGALEGFELLTINSANGVTVAKLDAVDLEELTIKGTGNLSIVNIEEETEKTNYASDLADPTGISIGDGIGIRKIDASGFSGTLNLDITSAVGQNIDPDNSGDPFYATIVGGSGNDTFWSKDAITGEDDVDLFDSIDGGAGSNTIKAFSDVGELAQIQNVQTLELRAGGQAADLDAFIDDKLTKVILREEINDAGFFLDSVGKTLAESGNIILQHATTLNNGGANDVEINLADATGDDDLVAVTVQNERNKETQFDYDLDIQGEEGDAVENVTINDNDTESNSVALINADEHTDTVTLTGGKAGQFYEVEDTLVAVKVDGGAQKSDLILRVGELNGVDIDQEIILGTGDDLLTFDNLDNFTGNDDISDKGGVDTMRAAFSEDVAGAPTIEGVEKLHIVATENTTFDMANVTGLTELALLSDFAVDDDHEVFSDGLTGVDPTDIITLENTSLSVVNFFGDVDGTGTDGGDTNDTDDSGAYFQTFNGLTLSDNSVDTVKVNIAAPLTDVGDNEDASASGDGVQVYLLGQLTTHGVKTLNVVVSDEYSEDGDDVKAGDLFFDQSEINAVMTGAPPANFSGNQGDAITVINNIFDKDLTTFTAQAEGDMVLGTVSGNGTSNNITSFDVSKVEGLFVAEVVALGDNAVVKLGAAENDFDGLGSAGKNVTISGQDENDYIRGTGQDDTIIGNGGNDILEGDRGDNVIKGGDGDETVTAKDGSNSVEFGNGLYETATINLNTGLNGSLATNSFTLSQVGGDGTVARLALDVFGDGTTDIATTLGVGAGSTLRVQYTGAVLNESTALLDGAKAITNAGAAYVGDANANFVIADAAGEATSFNGGAGNDVFWQLGSAEAITWSGGAGNDTFSGQGAYDHVLQGGAGADIIILANEGDAADVTVYPVTVAANLAEIIITDGESTEAAYDKVYGYNTDTGSNFLNLVFTAIGAGGDETADVAVGDIDDHNITAGVLEFLDDTAATLEVGNGADQVSLADAVAYLEANFNGSSVTLGFSFDENGDGDYIDQTDSFFVWQDGAADTLVQLIGVAYPLATEVAAIDTAAGAATVVIG